MQTIFTNCDPKGGSEPSLEISLDTVYHEVLFKVTTQNGAANRFSIAYPVSGNIVFNICHVLFKMYNE